MLIRKTEYIKVIIMALVLPLFIFGFSLILFPDQASQEPPIPMPFPKPDSLLNQILWTIQWVGLAALISITIVGVTNLINRRATNGRSKPN